MPDGTRGLMPTAVWGGVKGGGGLPPLGLEGLLTNPGTPGRMAARRTRRSFTREFKAQAVKRLLDGGKGLSEGATELGGSVTARAQPGETS